MTMTPDTIEKAAEALAKDASNWSEARLNGAAFGRALIAQRKSRVSATEQMNHANATEIEISLLQLAASNSQLLAEVADSALQELRQKSNGSSSN
jgi:hypothetical protein